MKAKTKIKIKRTVSVGLISLSIISATATMFLGSEKDNIEEKIDVLGSEISEAKGGMDNCLDIFKNSNYYKNYIITEQNDLVKKFENAQISSEDYSKRLSTLVSKEHAIEILQQSNEEILKNNYINLQQIKKEKESEYIALSDKENNMAISALAGLAGTVGFGIGAVAFPTKKDDEKKKNDYEEDYL